MIPSTVFIASPNDGASDRQLFSKSKSDHTKSTYIQSDFSDDEDDYYGSDLDYDDYRETVSLNDGDADIYEYEELDLSNRFQSRPTRRASLPAMHLSTPECQPEHPPYSSLVEKGTRRSSMAATRRGSTAFVPEFLPRCWEDKPIPSQSPNLPRRRPTGDGSRRGSLLSGMQRSSSRRLGAPRRRLTSEKEFTTFWDTGNRLHSSRMPPLPVRRPTSEHSRRRLTGGHALTTATVDLFNTSFGSLTEAAREKDNVCRKPLRMPTMDDVLFEEESFTTSMQVRVKSLGILPTNTSIVEQRS